jgi:PAS domain S-box-containing protein
MTTATTRNDLVTPGCGVPPDRLEPVQGVPSLFLIGPGPLGRSVRLDADELTIGRSDASDLVVDDPGVSRSHARVSRAGGGDWILTDAGSRNGTYVNGVKVLSTPLREGDKIQMGTVTAFRFSFREVAEEREARLARALVATGVGAFEWAPATNDVALSAGAERILSDGRGFWGSVHPDDRAGVAAALAAAASGQRVEAECRIAGPDGGRWYALRGQPFRGASGEVSHVAGAIVDVTARKLAEAELRRQALLFENLLDAVVVLDLGGVVIDWNRQAEKTFGWAKAEAVGRRPDELLGAAADGGDTVVIPLPAGPEPRELTLRRKDGREVVVEVVLVPLRDGAGRQVADIAVYRDVTERRHLQQRLVLADRLAALGTLAAGVAHEINNPLSFVLGNLVYLEGELPRAEAVQSGLLTSALQEARQGAERIRATVRDLLDLSRTRETEPVVDVDVNAALEFTLKVAEPQLRHRARIVRRLGEVPPVAAPETRFGQVLVNLVINAAQAIPEGEPGKNEVRVATRFDAERGMVELEVSDTGVGISEDDQRRIFDPFFTTKPVGQGTGLGLAISHGIVTSLGGEITVESERGQGATFRVRLPATRGVAVAARTGAGARARHARILVVDDEPYVGTVLQRLLGAHHEVVVAGKATEALVLLRAGARFDVILSDLLMPELTGMELYETLSREVPDQAARMVFMTGGAYTERARAFAARRQHRILAKPVDLAELERVLVELVGPADEADRGERRNGRPA